MTYSSNLFSALMRREQSVYFDPKLGQELLERRWIENLRLGKETETILTGPNEIASFTIGKQSEVVTTDSKNNINIWDLDTRQLKYSFVSQSKIKWKGLLKIVDDKLISSGSVRPISKSNHIIAIFDLKALKITATILGKGSLASTVDDEISPPLFDRVFIHNKTLYSFTKLTHSNKKNQDNLFGWDLDGNQLNNIEPDDVEFSFDNRFNTIKKSGHFRLSIKNNKMTVFNTISKTEKKIALPPIPAYSLDSTQNLLAVVSQRYHQGVKMVKTSLRIIDIEKSLITEDYDVENIVQLFSPKIRSTSFQPYIEKIHLRKNWVYIGHSSGTILGIDSANEKIVKIGSHSSSIQILRATNNMLISGSRRDPSSDFELKFWDLKSFKLIRFLNLKTLAPPLFQGGKLFYSRGKSLICLNFDVDSNKK